MQDMQLTQFNTSRLLALFGQWLYLIIRLAISTLSAGSIDTYPVIQMRVILIAWGAFNRVCHFIETNDLLIPAKKLFLNQRVL